MRSWSGTCWEISTFLQKNPENIVMRHPRPAAVMIALIAIALGGCGEPLKPNKDAAPTPAPIPSTPATPRIDTAQPEPAPGQVHASPTPADAGASSTHATPAPATAPVDSPGPGNDK